MAHTDRDHPSISDWWQWHVCDTPGRCTHPSPFDARRGEKSVGSVPSRWNREQRRHERTKGRRELTKIRVNAADWDDVPLRAGNSFRRPYYW